MAEIKGEHSLNVSVSEEVPLSDKKLPPKRKRVASLDIFRGLTVALMILVDDAGGQWPVIAHAPWNGCNLADFVMPFFLFIVGMAIPLSLKRIPNKLLAVKRVLVRTLKLLFWGLLLQGGFSHAPEHLTYGVDMKHIRWCGILQRIALAYLVVALVEIFSRSGQARDPEPTHLSIFKLYYWHWLVGACTLTVYMALLYGIYVPDWQFTVHDPDSIYNGTTFTVTCGVRGKLDPPCNAVGYIDREVLGINHVYKKPAWRRTEACTEKPLYEGPFKKNAPSWCYAPFDPEGILRSVYGLQILLEMFGLAETPNMLLSTPFSRFQSVLNYLGFVCFEVDAVIICDPIIENVFSHCCQEKSRVLPYSFFFYLTAWLEHAIIFLHTILKCSDLFEDCNMIMNN